MLRSNQPRQKSKPKQKPKDEISSADKRYCKKCYYYGNTVHLCRYMLETGERRGCNYGVGCTKKLEVKQK